MSDSSRAARVLAGDTRAAAQVMRDLDDGGTDGIADLKLLYPRTGRATIVGMTGNPGAGKSTLVDELITRYRAAGQRVGVVAIDPSSPFSGGAILGDRIRMQRHALDAGVFIRSLATRGQMGGLSRSTAAVVHVLDAMGFDVVIVETVGVGQDEIDVVGVCDTAVVVTVPGLGDEVQALKAGILEIADVLVVNKSDREGADRAVGDLVTMLDLRARAGARTEIVKTAATRGEGIDALAAVIEGHATAQKASGGWSERRIRRAGEEVRTILFQRLSGAAEAAMSHVGGWQALASEVAGRMIDPYTAAGQIQLPKSNQQ